ncbi:MAG: aminobenzoyl-glutamate transporter [Phycisphaerales bacterium]|nr:MAG: aminobenzoyl-glutamate transporter [Phycisphaerales bacterium]
MEWLGNCLPHPVTLFALLALVVAVVASLAVWGGWTVVFERPMPGGQVESQTIQARAILSGPGFRWLVENLVANFAGFAPLGTVLVALLGVAVAERSGLLGVCVRAMILWASPKLVTLMVVFAGVQSNIASEMGYVVLIPLAMGVFHALGRHPLAGLAASFAGVSGGYSANLLLGTIDPLLAGITQETARIVAPGYEVHAAVNWYFMIASVFVITPIGWAVTTYIVEPRLGRYDPSNADPTVEREPAMQPISPAERAGLARAGVAALACVLAFAYLAGPMATTTVEVPQGVTLEQYRSAEPDQRQAWHQQARQQGATRSLVLPTDTRFNAVVARLPAYGVLRNPETGGLLPSPFTRGIVAMIFVFFIIPGFVYGRAVGTMKNDRDVIDAMAHGMSTLGLYIVLVFFAAQFVAMFRYSRLGEMLAVVGADGIRAMGIDSPIVFVPFILMCCLINLMLGSASAQWAATAPIFVPMLMGVGYSPEVIQAAYRIGDSTTNIITPMMSYFGLILAVAARYDRKLGIGTMIATMLPYSIAFLVGWMVLFYVWVFALGLPVGPGAPTHFAP